MKAALLLLLLFPFPTLLTRCWYSGLGSNSKLNCHWVVGTQLVPVQLLVLVLLLLLFDDDPEPEELNLEFATDHQSKKKVPVLIRRDQRLSTTLLEQRCSTTTDRTAAS